MPFIDWKINEIKREAKITRELKQVGMLLYFIENVNLNQIIKIQTSEGNIVDLVFVCMGVGINKRSVSHKSNKFKLQKEVCKRIVPTKKL